MLLASPDFGAEAGVHFIQLGLAMLVAITGTLCFTWVIGSRRAKGASSWRGRVAISLGSGFLGLCLVKGFLDACIYEGTGPCEDLFLPALIGVIAAMVMSLVFWANLPRQGNGEPRRG
jgi:hypothetical protein